MLQNCITLGKIHVFIYEVWQEPNQTHHMTVDTATDVQTVEMGHDGAITMRNNVGSNYAWCGLKAVLWTDAQTAGNCGRPCWVSASGCT